LLTMFAVQAISEAMGRVGFGLPSGSMPVLALVAVLPLGFLLGVFAAWLASVMQMRRIRVV
ncbi:MAG: hypothetical protein AB7S56_09940, partial [Halothiobacillaceae bacterium]